MICYGTCLPGRPDPGIGMVLCYAETSCHLNVFRNEIHCLNNKNSAHSFIGIS
ncbi:hypothetical protein DFR42_103415 [Undibacterium pigrum]|uniref:Uncharacterized protein n=1 Tax=Undibacterium pigrum TaxID=401470 RepID=A0A318JBP3_9BURK|nr:hypothetical protein DFR42_103415 [Undibacterium pigrum]